MIDKLGQIAFPSGDRKTFQLLSEVDEMKSLRNEAAQDRELKRNERSRAPPERFLVKAFLMVFNAQKQKISSSLKTSKMLLILNRKTNLEGKKR